MNMKNQHFTTSIRVSNSASEVFQAVLDVRSWWSGLYDESFEGNSDNLGDEFSFRAGDGAHYSRQRLIEMVPDKKVVWQVVDANLNFVEKTDEWVGTRIEFTIEEHPDGTEIRFTHEGLVPEFECYNSCSPAWTRYIQERLTDVLANQKTN
jgi:hypothetical protein